MPKIRLEKEKWKFVSDRDSSLYLDLADGMPVKVASDIYHISVGHVYNIRCRLTWVYEHNRNPSNPFEDLPSFDGVFRGRPGTFYLVKKQPKNLVAQN